MPAKKSSPIGLADDALILEGAFSYSDRIAALLAGAVSVPGVQLRITSAPPSDIFAGICKSVEPGVAGSGAAYDVAEMSLGALAALRSRGEQSLVGLPVFTSRAFRHGMVYVNARAGVRCPADLNGKTIAIREWGMTALIWIIGILAEHHDFDWRSVNWIAARAPRTEMALPERYRSMSGDETISSLVASGRADAALFHELLPCFAAGDANVRRLFEPPLAAEQAYFEATGIFPPMHCVVLRAACVESAADLPARLFTAFSAARDYAYAGLLDTGAPFAMVPFLDAHMDLTRRVMGDDWWPYGLTPNRRALERLLCYAQDQGVACRLLAPEDLFLAL
ncbi:MAG: hypothetical protein AAF458_05105 [Pseudomonadota bacterium]